MRDLSGVVPDLEDATLGSASLASLRRIDLRSLPEVAAGQRIGPCVARCGKFICVGLNYREHARESGMTLPSEPVLFMKATSAIIGPNDAVIMPKDATKVDWEVELGVIIGSSIANASEREARGSIAGYCVVNDLSERAFQLEGTGQWVKGKSADTFGPIGPWLVTADEVDDPQALDLWLEVNGQRMQGQHERHGLRRSRVGELYQPFHEPAGGRHHLHGHPCRRRTRTEAACLSEGGRRDEAWNRGVGYSDAARSGLLGCQWVEAASRAAAEKCPTGTRHRAGSLIEIGVRIAQRL